MRYILFYIVLLLYSCQPLNSNSNNYLLTYGTYKIVEEDNKLKIYSGTDKSIISKVLGDEVDTSLDRKDSHFLIDINSDKKPEIFYYYSMSGGDSYQYFKMFTLDTITKSLTEIYSPIQICNPNYYQDTLFITDPNNKVGYGFYLLNDSLRKF